MLFTLVKYAKYTFTDTTIKCVFITFILYIPINKLSQRSHHCEVFSVSCYSSDVCDYGPSVLSPSLNVIMDRPDHFIHNIWFTADPTCFILFGLRFFFLLLSVNLVAGADVTDAGVLTLACSVLYMYLLSTGSQS